MAGFSEDDQANLYMAAHDASGKGRQGLGIASRPKKVAGARWQVRAGWPPCGSAPTRLNGVMRQPCASPRARAQGRVVAGAPCGARARPALG